MKLTNMIGAACVAALLPVAARAQAYTFDSSVAYCAAQARSIDPGFMVFVINGPDGGVDMLGDLRSRFIFKDCMNYYGHPASPGVVEYQ